MKNKKRHNLIKKICERRKDSENMAELTFAGQGEIEEEFSYLNTEVENLDPSQDSENWHVSFMKDLIFNN